MRRVKGLWGMALDRGARFLALLSALSLPAAGWSHAEPDLTEYPENWLEIIRNPKVEDAVIGKHVYPDAEVKGPVQHVRRQPAGALSGRVMFIGAGHGWTADTTNNVWFLQRGIPNTAGSALFGLNEDYGNVDQMNIFAQYLWNAGATVVPTRPLGNQRNEVVLDQDDTTPGPRGVVTYTGTWSSSSTTPHYSILPDSETYRFTSAVTTGPFPTARYTPNIPADGYYPVYTWVLQSSNRANTLYRVAHAGGTTEMRVPHAMVGRGWVWLGTYFFEAGSNGHVEIVGDRLPGDSGTVVIADAIRFGNGLGDVSRGFGGTGLPREEEASRYWAQVSIGAGAPTSIYDSPGSVDSDDNVGTPIRWAAAMNNESVGQFKDRLYISFHSNAGGGRGADGLYNDASLFPGTNTPNQLALALALGREINEDMRQLDTLEFPGFPEWTNKTTHTFRRTDYAFGEIRNNVLGGEMDATIIEVAYHDSTSDAPYLKDPLARKYIARSTYQGVIRFYRGTHGESTLKILPDEPRNLRARNATDGTRNVILNWQAPLAQASIAAGTPGNIGGDAPTDYAIYMSTNGRDFQYLTNVGGTNTTYTVSNLAAGTQAYFQVTGVNSGGESFPSNIAGARVLSATGNAPILIVDGFDRFDNAIAPKTLVPNTTLFSSSMRGRIVERVIPLLTNDFSYVMPTGVGLHLAAPLLGSSYVRPNFDSCTNDDVLSGAVALSNYRAVVWILGEESTVDETFTTAEQGLVRSYLQGGGNLFVSGSEIGWDLGRSGSSSAADLSFFNNDLRTTYVADNANTYNAQGTGIFASVGSLTFSNGSNGFMYDPAFPDILGAGSGASAAMTYVGGAGGNAAISFPGTGNGGRVIVMGFPFETILDSAKRAEIMNQTIRFFGLDAPAGLTDTWMIF